MDASKITTPHDWAAKIAWDIRSATWKIGMTAMSMQAPRNGAVGPWPTVWDAMVTASRAGVAITITLPAAQPAHPATMGNNGAARDAHDYGMHVVLVPGPRLLHAKQVVIDQRILWIGSANMTAAAYAHNIEAWVRIFDGALAEKAAERIALYGSRSGA